MTVVRLIQGPFHYWFYTILDRVLPGRSAKLIVKKTLLDQSIASPTCLAIFFVGLGILEHCKSEEICKELKLKLKIQWIKGCLLLDV
ncbi:mpv17-like protein 2-like protein [Lasius niger]|uniref:Mpv17-like protein 2-like protein n=1 Tax=Lasius niger TaxID=67767 RepID=A0A0J7JWW7_LASNI|nr:mpv17-like protein 2-like protein [Lasius niger]